VCVVDVKSLVPGNPALDVRMFVSRVMVGNDMDLFFFGNMPIDLTKKGDPILVGMAVPALAEHRSIQRVECRK